MKTFYIFYTYNKDANFKGMAISVARDQKTAVSNFRSKMVEKVMDPEDEVKDFHVWWIEELVTSEEVVIIP